MHKLRISLMQPWLNREDADMRQKIYTDVPNDKVEKFCKQQKKSFGATKCEATDKGGGKSDVLVEYPSAS